jgi:hypothetical protein
MFARLGVAEPDRRANAGDVQGGQPQGNSVARVGQGMAGAIEASRIMLSRLDVFVCWRAERMLFSGHRPGQPGRHKGRSGMSTESTYSERP